MADIVSFKPEPSLPTGEYCLKCGECGCTTFYALDNGEVECALCKVRPTNGWWTPASVPQSTDPDNLADQVITSGDDFAKRRTVQRANEEGAVTLVVFQANGVITTWVDSDSIDGNARDWLGRQMSIATKMLHDDAVKATDAQPEPIPSNTE